MQLFVHRCGLCYECKQRWCGGYSQDDATCRVDGGAERWGVVVLHILGVCVTITHTIIVHSACLYFECINLCGFTC